MAVTTTIVSGAVAGASPTPLVTADTISVGVMAAPSVTAARAVARGEFTVATTTTRAP